MVNVSDNDRRIDGLEQTLAAQRFVRWWEKGKSGPVGKILAGTGAPQLWHRAGLDRMAFRKTLYRLSQSDISVSARDP